MRALGDADEPRLAPATARSLRTAPSGRWAPATPRVMGSAPSSTDRDAAKQPPADVPAVITIMREPRNDEDGAALAKTAALDRAVAPAQFRKSTCARVGEAVLVLLTLGIVALFGVLVWQMVELRFEPRVIGWGGCGLVVALTCLLGIVDITRHIIHYSSPLQRHYIRILAMPLLYSVESWLALRWTDQKIYLETARDCYEAWVLYTFFALLVEFMGGKRALAAKLKASGKERAKRLPPCCCLRGWRLGSRFVHRTMLGVYQYVALRVIVSIIIAITEATHVYKEGNWSPRYFYLYACLIVNASQCYALYVLALLYVETRHLLKPLSPILKFGVIKFVVFACWWQTIIVAGLASLHVLPPLLDLHTSDEVAKALANLLIVIEMALVASLHNCVFSYRDFHSSSGTTTPLEAMRAANAAFAASAADGTLATPAGANGLAGGTPSLAPDGTVTFASPTPRTGRPSRGFSAAASGDTSEAAIDTSDVVPVTPATSTSATNGVAATPAARGVGAAIVEMLPGDVLAETAEHLRTGFGLTHKWEKRRREAEEAAKVQAQVDAALDAKLEHMRTAGAYPRAKTSRFAHDDGSDGDGGGGATSSGAAATAAPALLAGSLPVAGATNGGEEDVWR